MALPEPAVTLTVAPEPDLSKVKVPPLLAIINEFPLLKFRVPTVSLASKSTVYRPDSVANVAVSPGLLGGIVPATAVQFQLTDQFAPLEPLQVPLLTVDEIVKPSTPPLAAKEYW